MIKVPEVVKELLENDEVAIEALQAGLLNFSAYADKIHRQVENATFKKVMKGTVVVALSRLAKTTNVKPPRKPDVKVKNLKLTSSLACVSFKKTVDLQRKLAVIHPFTISTNDLFSVIEGVSEVTVICSEESLEELLKHITSPIKSKFTNLAAITAQLPEEYAHTPNIYHVLINSLAAKRINIVEIVSTYTEISFLVKKEDMENALKALNIYFRNKNT